VKVLTNFASAFASSLVVAALDFIFFFGTPMLSAVLTFLWIGAVAFAFSMFKWRGFWFFFAWCASGWLRVLRPIPDVLSVRSERQRLPMNVGLVSPSLKG
jgi:hypothetical protein